MGFLNGKRALIVGLASNRSIAAGIAEAFHQQGAELAFTYQNEKLKSRVEQMASEWGSDLVLPCEVTNDQEIAHVAAAIKEKWGGLDILVHSVAYAPQEELQGDYVDAASREGFRIAHDISVYSLTALCKAFKPLMLERESNILTMTYLGAERTIPNYNVMGLAKASLEANVRYLAASLGPQGIRVNAISAGPIRTLAASGIAGLRKMLDHAQRVNPLRINVSIEQVGNAAAFLCSELAQGVTGEVLHVDAGFHIVGMGALDEEKN